MQVEREGPVGMPSLAEVFGVSIAITFAGFLLPARIGAERMAERQGQLGPRTPLLAGIGVLAGVSIVGGWGGPVGMGIALAALAWSTRGAATPADDTAEA